MIAAALALSTAAAAPQFIYSPYKHLAMWRDASHRITVAPDGVAMPFLSLPARPATLT